MPPKAGKSKSKTKSSGSETECETRKSGRLQSKATRDYKKMHEGEGKKDLSPVEESELSEAESVHNNKSSSSGQDGDESSACSSGETEEQRSDEIGDEELAGFTSQSSEEDNLDVQINRHKVSLEKIKAIEEQSKQHIHNLEKLLKDKKEVEHMKRQSATPTKR